MSNHLTLGLLGFGSLAKQILRVFRPLDFKDILVVKRSASVNVPEGYDLDAVNGAGNGRIIDPGSGVSQMYDEFNDLPIRFLVPTVRAESSENNKEVSEKDAS